MREGQRKHFGHDCCCCCCDHDKHDRHDRHDKHRCCDHDKHDRHDKHCGCDHDKHDRHDRHDKHCGCDHDKHDRHDRHDKHCGCDHDKHDKHDSQKKKDHSRVEYEKDGYKVVINNYNTATNNNEIEDSAISNGDRSLTAADDVIQDNDKAGKDLASAFNGGEAEANDEIDVEIEKTKQFADRGGRNEIED